jgi:hypothetical protein
MMLGFLQLTQAFPSRIAQRQFYVGLLDGKLHNIGGMRK